MVSFCPLLYGAFFVKGVPHGSYQFSAPVFFCEPEQPLSFVQSRLGWARFLQGISLVRPRRRLSLAPTAER